MSRASLGLPVIWTWDVLSEVLLGCQMHLMFHGIEAKRIEVADQFVKEHNI
jgi:hypothetical protein